MAELSVMYENTVEITGQDFRHAFDALQEGVVGATDLKVSPGAAADTVDVAAGIGFVRGDGLNDLGLYRCRNDATKNSAAFEAGGIAAPDATKPRLDQIIARVYDDDVDNEGLHKWRLAVLKGTPKAGDTLDKREGATALPNSAVRLADVLVPAGGPAALKAENIRDRRPWARGAFRRIRRIADAGGADDYSTSSGSFAEIDAVNLKPRIECSGVPLRLQLIGFMEASVGAFLGLEFFMDGTQWEGSFNPLTQSSAPQGPSVLLEWVGIPAAGSHLFSPAWSTSSGTLTLAARANWSCALVIEELIRQDADNS